MLLLLTIYILEQLRMTENSMTTQANTTGKKFGIDAGELKWIAILTMLIDHIGAAVFVIYTSFYDGKADFVNANDMYRVIRGIGRTAFPIFCFLLVEGLYHTKNLKKYLFRLFLFCLISEVPFDLAFHDGPWDMASQNVYWTLFLGMACIASLRYVDRQFMEPDSKYYNAIQEASNGRMAIKPGVTLFAFRVLIVAVFAGISYVLKTDYDVTGILLIVVLYCMRDKRLWQSIVGYCCFSWEIWCFPAFILTYFYNGQRGKQMKYFFYIFYPAHLLLLYFVRMYLKQ